MTPYVLTLVLVVLIGLYVTWTANRLDRLHARVDAAWAALDAQLLRRAAAARVVARSLPPGPDAAGLEAAARASLDVEAVDREARENDLSRALRLTLPCIAPGPDLDELATASARVGLARSFHNAAVRDTRAVRLRRLPRALRLHGHRAMPDYFEIDDTTTPH